MVGELPHVLLRQLRDELGEVLVPVEDLLHVVAHRGHAELLLEHVPELRSEHARTPAEVRLEDLPDVHAARNAERVEHDVDRRAVLQVRHVLFGEDARDDALVAVAPGHLVADLELALDGDVDLHHLDDARGQLVALGEAVDLVAEVVLAEGHDLFELADLLRDLFHALDGQIRPVLVRDLGEDGVVEHGALLDEDLALVVDELARRRQLAELLLDLAVERVAEDLDLLVAHLLETHALLILDVLATARPSRCPCGRRRGR